MRCMAQGSWSEAWVTAASCLLMFLALLSPVSAQWDPTTGRIQPTPGVPSFDPVPWNSAYKLTFKSVPFNGPNDLPSWPNAPIRYLDTPSVCSSEGFDSTPASSVKWETCFYKNNTDDTFDFWRKQPGLAFMDANCYCYALNKFEGGSCSPGTSQAQARYMATMTCPAMHQAMIDDGATPVGRQQALSRQPDRGHYIAMMARAAGGCIPTHCGSDFHFIRKDSSGTWSHKLPLTPATDKDLEGNPISDPEAAPLPGQYLVCGYYQVEPEKMPTGTKLVRSSPGPVEDMTYPRLWSKQSNVDVGISPVPYNPAIDARLDSRVQRLFSADAVWERKRGSKEYDEWKKQQLELLELTPADSKRSDGSKGGSTSSSGDRSKGSSTSSSGDRSKNGTGTGGGSASISQGGTSSASKGGDDSKGTGSNKGPDKDRSRSSSGRKLRVLT